MTFNDEIRTNPNRVRRRSGPQMAGTIGGVGIVGALLLVLLSNITGVNLTGLAGGGAPAPAVNEADRAGGGQDDSLAHCVDGLAANKDVNCRMLATIESVDVMWSKMLPQEAGIKYVQPEMELFTGSTRSGCGQASSATGPFYCPLDQSIYIDTSFFQLLETQLGAQNAPLAQAYIVAHEAGHHIQQLEGTFDRTNRRDTGPKSDQVRIELQADCYAGIWVGHAANTIDPETGVAFLAPPTEAEVQSALDAAEAVGDDRIQEAQSGQVRPDTFTHGSAAQRMKWFKIGYEQGTMAACNTFATDDL